MQARMVIEHLRTVFRVGRQVQLRIVERQQQPVMTGTIQIAEHNIATPHRYLRTEYRQQMRPFLVFAPFPLSDVTVSIIRIMIGAVVNQGVHTRIQTDILQRLISQARLYPQSGQRIALHDIAGKLIVLEKAEIVHFQPQLAGMCRIQPVFRRHNGPFNLCLHRGRNAAEQTGEKHPAASPGK